MNWARIGCFFKGHILTHLVNPGYLRMPVRCLRCDYVEAGIEYPPMPPVKPPAEPTFERAQIIATKPGDTIVVTAKSTLSNDQRALLRAMFVAHLPEGVKLMVLEGGTTLTHIRTGTAPHIPQPTPERSST